MSISKAAEVRQHCPDEYVMQKTGNEASVVQSSVWVTDSCHINVKIQIPAFVSTFRITQRFHPIPTPPYLSVSCFSFQRLFIASNLHHLFNMVNSKHRLKYCILRMCQRDTLSPRSCKNHPIVIYFYSFN